MKKIALVVAILSIAGCASTPIPNEEAQPVPGKQILQTDLLVKKDNTGKVIIKRDSGFVGSMCLSRVYVDGKELADLDPAQKIEIYPTVGSHIFSTKPRGICAGGIKELEGKVAKDGALIYRIGYGAGGDHGIYPTAF
jgi:hypothetical protein